MKEKKHFVIKEKQRHSLSCSRCKKTTNHYLVSEQQGKDHKMVYLKCSKCKNKIPYGTLKKFRTNPYIMVKNVQERKPKKN